MAFLLVGTENIGMWRSRFEYHEGCGLTQHYCKNESNYIVKLRMLQFTHIYAYPKKGRLWRQTDSGRSTGGWNCAGIQVEEPFSIMTVDAFCTGIEATLRDIMRSYQGKKPTSSITYVLSCTLALVIRNVSVKLYVPLCLHRVCQSPLRSPSQCLHAAGSNNLVNAVQAANVCKGYDRVEQYRQADENIDSGSVKQTSEDTEISSLPASIPSPTEGSFGDAVTIPLGQEV